MVLCLTLHCMYKMLVWCSVIAVVFTAIVFVYQIRQHQKHYLQPFLQRCYLRICLIPPIYSISAYIGLYLTIKKISYAPYVNYAFEVLCDFYEGYALYVFFITMALCSGGETVIRSKLEEDPSNLYYTFFGRPIFQMSDAKSAVRIWKASVSQFMVLKPLFSLFSVISIGLFEESEESNLSNIIEVILKVFSLISAFIALQGILNIYYLCKIELDKAQYSPAMQLLCIKMILICTVVQRFVLAVVAENGGLQWKVFAKHDSWLRAAMMNRMLIIGEMFIASIVFHHTFSYLDAYKVSRRPIPNPVQYWGSTRSFSFSFAAQENEHVAVARRKNTYHPQMNSTANLRYNITQSIPDQGVLPRMIPQKKSDTKGDILAVSAPAFKNLSFDHSMFCNQPNNFDEHIQCEFQAVNEEMKAFPNGHKSFHPNRLGYNHFTHGTNKKLSNSHNDRDIHTDLQRFAAEKIPNRSPQYCELLIIVLKFWDIRSGCLNESFPHLFSQSGYVKKEISSDMVYNTFSPNEFNHGSPTIQSGVLQKFSHQPSESPVSTESEGTIFEATESDKLISQ